MTFWRKGDVYFRDPCALGWSDSLDTITTKKTWHLSQPPSQHTRQSSMRSPSDTGLQSRRNFV